MVLPQEFANDQRKADAPQTQDMLYWFIIRKVFSITRTVLQLYAMI
jgi:hypothetical protein